MIPLKPLPKVIKIDSEKCVNCHLCIGVCPVKYCNNASDTEKGILINDNLCIGCGNCIKVCTHDARIIVDDTEKFIEDLNSGEKIAVLVSPATDVQFPGQLKNLLGWLKQINVQNIYDVSFGAEITTYQYLQVYQSGKANLPIIAQPCPAVVSFIEIYKPELLKYLAPTGSPVMNMACWVHQNNPGLKLAFLSPCIAKKREFEDPNTKGLVHYNVTIANLKKYIEKNEIDLTQYSGEFDGPIQAERGLLYSKPGGLYETLKRYNVPLKPHQVRRTEGVEIYEEFFEELEQELENEDSDVILIDILNCLHGCNRGTGVKYDEFTTNQILKRQDERLEEHKQQHYPDDEHRNRLEALLKDMANIDFSRNYTDRSASFKLLMDPTDEQIEVLHQEMGKFEKEDLKNCGACGYHSCDNMAKAVLNGLYRPEQCHHFLEKFFFETHEEK